MEGRTSLELALRPWSSGDLALLLRLMGSTEMTRFIGGPETEEKIRERHARYAGIAGTGKGRMFVIVAGPDAVPAGSVGYWETTWQDRPVFETGWSVLPEFQGRGVATRGTALGIEAARADQKHRWLHAFPSVVNLASNAVCRKLGFTFVGECAFEYPKGTPLRPHNDWRLQLWPEGAA